MYKSSVGNKKVFFDIKKLEMLKDIKQVSQLFKSVTWLLKVHFLASLSMLQTGFPVFRSFFICQNKLKSSPSCLLCLTMIFCTSKQVKSLSDNTKKRAAIVIGDGLYCARADHYFQPNNYS